MHISICCRKVVVTLEVAGCGHRKLDAKAKAMTIFSFVINALFILGITDHHQ